MSIIVSGSKASLGNKKVSLNRFVDKVLENNRTNIAFPDGLKFFCQKGDDAAAVYEIKPAQYKLKWQDGDYFATGSTKNYKYTEIMLNFPYVVLVLWYYKNTGKWRLARAYRSGIFFRNKPLQDLFDELFLPPLTNYFFDGAYFDICLPERIGNKYKNISEAVSGGLKEFYKLFFESGFNYDITQQAYIHVDNWKGMSMEDVLKYDWKDTNYSVQGFLNRNFINLEKANISDLCRPCFDYEL